MNWIKCSERMPEKNTPVLAFCLIGFHCHGLKDDRILDALLVSWNDDYENVNWKTHCYCSGAEHDREYIEPLFWLPIPNPPTGKP